MFSAFNALNNPEKQEFLFLFPSEEATAQDSGHLPKVAAFNSNLPHLASNSFIFPPYSFPYTFYPLGGWVLSFLWNESESTYLLRMWNLHDYKHFWTLAWPFGPFLPKLNFEPGLPHFTQHYIQVDVYRCIRCSICVIMLSFLPPGDYASHTVSQMYKEIHLGLCFPPQGCTAGRVHSITLLDLSGVSRSGIPRGDLLPYPGNDFPTCIKPAISPEICAGYFSFNNSCLLKGYIWYATIQGNVMQCSQFNSLQDKSHENNNNKSFQDGDQVIGKRTGKTLSIQRQGKMKCIPRENEK